MTARNGDAWNLRDFLQAHNIPAGHVVVFLDHSYQADHTNLAQPFEARCQCGWRVSGNDRTVRANDVIAHWDTQRNAA